MRPSGLLRRGRVVAAFLVAAAVVSSAFAETGEEAARRLADSRYFVEKLGRGWEPLVRDAAKCVTEIPEAERPAVVRERDGVFETYAKAIRGRDEKGLRRAFELLEVLSKEHGDPSRRPEFARECAGIEVDWADAAEKAGRDDEALRLALSAAERSPGFDRAYGVIARLALKESRKAQEKDDFFTALDILDRSKQSLPAGSSAQGTIEGERQAILSTTGTISIDWLGDAAVMDRIRSAKTDFRGGKLSLKPLGGTKAPPDQQIGKPMRVRNGRYDVTARGSGPAEYRPGAVEVTSAGASVTLLTAMPEGMILVPAAGGNEPFLVDRTEVSVGEWNRLEGRRLPGSPNTAAAGISFDEAKAWAERNGKQLPTWEQWSHAAFGSPNASSPRWPWGDQEPVAGTHFQGGLEGPGPVDGCPAGASRTGCLNMAGNVWEWLADGWMIGGGYVRDELKLELLEENLTWTAVFVRDKAPSQRVWEALSADLKGKYFNYNARKDTTQAQIGLRCVVPLGRPRRQP
ncbi:MAG: Hercynine oxygenase [Planctomycetes bacterium]|nr:Hercynine oxygenase [Planctomycetota bacterium]